MKVVSIPVSIQFVRLDAPRSRALWSMTRTLRGRASL